MHERLERHVRDHIRHPGDEDVADLIETHGFERILNILAFEAIKLRNEAEAEGDDSGKSAYANLALKLLRASDEHSF